MRRYRIIFGIIMLLCLLNSTSSFLFAQPIPVFPSRTLTMICPWAAGGGSDRVARKVAELLGNELKQKVNLVNRIGGGGVIGFTAGATAEPNGYTLTFFTTEVGTLHWMGVTNITYKSFINIALVNVDPAGIVVRMDSPWQTFEELQNAIRENPGRLRASGTSKGGIWDLCRAGWLLASGLKVNSLSWFPSNGAAPALQQLEAGQVDVVICGLAEAGTALQSGKVRPLAIMAPKRDPHFKNVPTLIQRNIHFADGSFRGVAVPAGTPPEVVATLENAMEKVVKSREFTDFMHSNGFGILYLRSSKLTAFLEERDKAFGHLIKEAGLAGE